MTRISAQDTLFAHSGTESTAALALTIVSNPSGFRERLRSLSLSALLVAVDEINTEASQP